MRFVKAARICSLKPMPKNPRAHTDLDLDALVRSIGKFGWTNPVLVQAKTNRIIAGAGRIEAAQRLGLKTVPAVYLDLDKTDATAYSIADNQLAALSDWDIPKLQDLLKELTAESFDISVIGFSDGELKKILNFELPSEDHLDVVPDPPKKPVTRRGDLWSLGDHRMLCGDATSLAAMDRLFGSKRAAMVFTDPPYGVSYESQSGKFDRIKNDEKVGDDLCRQLLIPALKMAARRASASAAFYVWHASSTRDDFSFALKSAGLIERQYLIWIKNAPVLGHADYQWSHEPCFYASKAEQSPAFYGDRAQRTVWRAAHRTEEKTAAVIGPGLVLIDGAGSQVYIAQRSPAGKKLRTIRLIDKESIELATDSSAHTAWEVSRGAGADHPTAKPVELALRAISNSSREGEIVFDSFLGSGCTLIGAEQLSRRCFATEWEPKYCDVVIERWQTMTGKKATRQRAVAASHE